MATTEVPRSPRARTAAIAFRTAHLGAMAVLVGGYHFDVASPSLRPWQTLTVMTGFALLLVEASHTRHWFYQVRGVVALCHVAAVVLIAAAPGMVRSGIAAALVLGSVGSHLPRTVRKWSFRHRRIIE